MRKGEREEIRYEGKGRATTIQWSGEVISDEQSLARGLKRWDDCCVALRKKSR